MELNNFNFIQAQSLMNQSMIKAVSELTKNAKSMTKSIRKAKSLSTFGFIFSAVAAAALFAEMKAEKVETDRQISMLKEEIEELKRGE